MLLTSVTETNLKEKLDLLICLIISETPSVMTYLYFLFTSMVVLGILLWCLPFWPIFGSNRDQSEDEESGNANVIV